MCFALNTFFVEHDSYSTRPVAVFATKHVAVMHNVMIAQYRLLEGLVGTNPGAIQEYDIGTSSLTNVLHS